MLWEDAKEVAIEFYEKMGFAKFFDTEHKLYMTIADIHKSI